jgi:T4 bacteriophage base plate protein
MALPKIEYPTINIQIPPENKTYQFRPMLVKEEKLLLMAKVSDDETDMLQAIKQVVNNCLIDTTLDVNGLPLYALEYIFVKLRGFSIGDKISVSYRDLEDNKNYDFEIDLNKVEIKFPDGIDNKIAITDKSGLTLKYPTAEIYSDKLFLKSEGEETFYRLVIRCINQIYDGDTVHEGKEFDEDALLEFLEYIDIPNFEKIRNFMLNLPSLYYKIEYTNSNNNHRQIELKTLSDFFTLR